MLRDIAPGTPCPRTGFWAEKLALPDDRLGRRVWQELLVEAKYDGYLQRESVEINRLKKLEETAIPENFDYCKKHGIFPCVCVPDHIDTYKKYVELGCRMFTSNDIYEADRILKELGLRL